jgi:hypothetical protein
MREILVHKEFEVHTLNEAGTNNTKQIAACFDVLMNAITDLVPSGRELAIVKTKLEEACFFAKKGIACSPYNQK